MEPKGPEWLGVEIIQASDLKPKGIKASLAPLARVGVLVRRNGGVGTGGDRGRCPPLVAP